MWHLDRRERAAGWWDLGLAEGRSRDMYEMLDATHVEARLANARRDFAAAPALPSQPVALHSLSGAHILLPLRKRQEYTGQDVLEVYGRCCPDAHSPSCMPTTSNAICKAAPSAAVLQYRHIAGSTQLTTASVALQKAEPKGWLSGGGRERVEGDVINIFSIASGHMYERLQKIMMLSVLRHTKSKVKFWLIKNYMSPQMQAFLPRMAAEYGFEVRKPSLRTASSCVCRHTYFLSSSKFRNVLIAF